MEKKRGLDVQVRDAVAVIVGKMELPQKRYDKKHRAPLVATPLKVTLGDFLKEPITLRKEK
jgi:hypothetical protein